jgi:hypothetical protein
VYTYNGNITFINDAAKKWGVRTFVTKQNTKVGINRESGRHVIINRAFYPAFGDGKYQSGLIQAFQV